LTGKKIIIFSGRGDAHAAAVKAELTRVGERPCLLDLSAFPQRLSLTMGYSGDRRAFEIAGEAGELLDFNSVQSAWWRRPQKFVFPPELIDPDALCFADLEARMAFDGLYLSSGIRWMNPPHLDVVAAQKPYQLALAQSVGLAVPDTLITNDPAAVLNFREGHPNGVIHKQFVARLETWRETRALQDADLDHIATVKAAPVQFQERIAAVAEVRAIVVGDEIFAGAALFAGLPYGHDIRMNMDATYTRFALPPDIADKLHQLVRKLGLIYGAIDLLLTSEGRFFFLEINPAGQFLYIERHTGQPITAAISAWLSQRR
jgi:glutathione synthase/RimK-type ligase-like ATP-grasp enzyme